jgi:hypothetical protein
MHCEASRTLDPSPQTDANHGDPKGHRLPRFGDFLQLLKHRKRLALAPGPAWCVRQRCNHGWPRAHESASTSNLLHGSIGHPFGHRDTSHHDVGDAETRIELQRFFESRD